MRVLITGASKGLGAVVAKAYAEQGHTLHLMARSEDSLTKLRATLKNPDWHSVYPCDFTKLSGFSWSGEVDAVIHCAGGGLGLRGPLLTAQAFYELFMVNLGGQAEINRFVLPGMMHDKKGYIVHVCSVASGEAIGSVGYNTVKAALAAYVRSLGAQMAPYGIVVSGIAPGAFQCEGNAMDRLQVEHPDAYLDFVQNRLPRKRMGMASELIPMIELLTSPAGSMMGGSVVAMDAGEGKYYA